MRQTISDLTYLPEPVIRETHQASKELRQEGLSTNRRNGRESRQANVRLKTQREGGCSISPLSHFIYWHAATPKAPAMADATAMITFSTMSQVKDLFLVSIRIAV